MSASATGLYTKEQLNYVDNIKDDQLRDELIYQIRLRDNMEKDRNEFEKKANAWPSLSKAIERLTNELNVDKKEGSYYHSWQANIAMAFKDEFERQYPHSSTGYLFDMHKITNDAAKSFLDLLISHDSNENPPTKDLTFGQAAYAAKYHSKKVARIGWNGSGMYAYVVPAGSYPATTEIAKKEFGDMVPYREYWALKTAQGDVATWAPSGSDSLAEDWYIVE